MKMPSPINALAVALLLAAVALPVSWAGWFVYQKHLSAQSKLDEVEPRYARLLGLKANAQELDKSIEGATALINLHAYPASQDATQVGNDAQQRLRAVFTAAGMDVVSSQILPVKTSAAPFEKIALSVRVEGQLVGFQAAMAALSLSHPTVWVEGYVAQIMGNVTATAPQRLSIALTLYVMRGK